MDNNNTRYAGDLVLLSNGYQGTIHCFPTPSHVSFGETSKHFHYNLLQNFSMTHTIQPGETMTRIQQGALSLRSLPCKFHGPDFINFVATSNIGNWADVAEVALQDLKAVFNAHTNENMIVVSQLLAMLADNPQAAVICQQAGPRADKHCQICYASPTNTATCFQQQRLCTLSSTNQTLNQMKMACASAADALCKSTGIAIPEESNIYLELPGFFPSTQTPVELLHSILLGAVKYLAYESKERFSRKPLKPRVASLFMSVSTFRRNPLSTKQVTHYIGSMIGKDFKALAQIGPFFFPWVHQDFTWLWLSVVILTKLSYANTYGSRYEHFVLLQKATSTFQMLFYKKVAKGTTKLKVHILAHLPDHFWFWGPLSLYATEIPKQMNGDVRKAIFASNRHSPSQDVAFEMSIREGAVSLLCGINSTSEGLKSLATHPVIQKHVLQRTGTAQPKIKYTVGQF
ncbi:hypothetical protein HDU78_010742 [Chytriomyces hyalinus]|nr:hypothetical protein HDU78_010742 [Chytriomyces hyalinus]